MSQILRVLMVEDDPNDAELLTRKLRAGGFLLETERVDQIGEVRRALCTERWDVVLCDHSMPGFRSADVLALMKAETPAVPLILVSGAIGEHEVVDALHLGAASYVDKNSLARLVPTLERVLQETQLRREHAAAQERLEMLASAVNSANDLILVLQAQEAAPPRVLYANQSVERLMGYSCGEVQAAGLDLFHGPETDAGAANRLAETIGRGEATTSELLLYKKDGGTVWVETEIHPITTGSNQFVAVSRDITERKKAEAQLAFLATHDPLTSLANRVLLHEQLEKELAKARRSGLGVGVMVVDLDGFKAVNDSFGHAAGDDLLREIADRLRHTTRESDIVARVGGDEFVVVLGGTENLEQIATTAQRILTTVRQPVEFGGQYTRPAVSIGIGVYPMDGEDAHSLIKSADTAMYHVKERGKNAYHFHTMRHGA
jgi:diguanylate cyclase (GGDEF)-like protein/PAS domain S-box-containing protein